MAKVIKLSDHRKKPTIATCPITDTALKLNALAWAAWIGSAVAFSMLFLPRSKK